MICLWMNSIEPTSMPRVGWSAMSRTSSRLNSRATMTFCWLPPDRVEVGTAPDGVRMSYWGMSSAARALMAFSSMTPKRENGRFWYSVRTRLS
jgi:hypothetical protein